MFPGYSRRCSGPLALTTLPPPRPCFLGLRCTSCVADKSARMGTSDQLFSAFLPIMDFYDRFSAEIFFFILDESYIYLSVDIRTDI